MKWLEARLKDWNAHVKKLRREKPTNTLYVVPAWFYPWKYQEREDVWRGLVAEVILACLARPMTKKKFEA